MPDNHKIEIWQDGLVLDTSISQQQTSIIMVDIRTTFGKILTMDKT
jgi:hypothetical protein